MSTPNKWRALVLLSLAELFGMSLWFSGSAVVPALSQEWKLSSGQVSWLANAVQFGFVAGTLISATLNLADIITTRHLFAVAALLGALSNAFFGLYVHQVNTAIGLRFLTGVCLAGAYPPGMKLMATWFRERRGMALGVLVGALTMGKATPYLVNALGSANWRINVVFVSILAVLGGLIVLLFVSDGPYALPPASFDLTQIVKVFGNRGVRLANFGYFGHMWELYAMWIWVPVMIRATLAAQQGTGVAVDSTLAEVGSFLVIGAGAIGSVVAGFIAHRVGRTVVTSVAMAI